MSDCELITRNAIYCVAILGNSRNEYELVDMSLPESCVKNSQARGMGLVGVIGIVDGRPRVALEVELPESTIAALSKAFVSRIEAAIIQFEQSMAAR